MRANRKHKDILVRTIRISFQLLLTAAGLLALSATPLYAQNDKPDTIGVLPPSFDFKLKDPFEGAPKSVRNQIEALRPQMEAAYQSLQETAIPAIQQLWIDNLKAQGIRAVRIEAVRIEEEKAEAARKGATLLLATKVRSWTSQPSFTGTELKSFLPSPGMMLAGIPGLEKLANKADPRQQLLGPARHVKAVFSLEKIDGAAVLPNVVVEKSGSEEKKDYWSEVAGDLASKVKPRVASFNSSLVEPPIQINANGGGHLNLRTKSTTTMGKRTFDGFAPQGPTGLDIASGALALSKQEGSYIWSAEGKVVTILNPSEKTYSQMSSDTVAKFAAIGQATPEPQLTLIPGSEPGVVRFKSEAPTSVYGTQETSVNIRTGASNEAWTSLKRMAEGISFINMEMLGTDPQISLAIWKQLLKLENPPVEVRISSAFNPVGKKAKYASSMDTVAFLEWSEPANLSMFRIPRDYKPGPSPILASLYF